MPLNFKSQPGSAVDLDAGLAIYRPRMLPASPPDDPNDVELQYLFYRNDDRFYGLALSASDEMVDKGGRWEQVFTLDLSNRHALEAVFKFKKLLGDESDDFSFLRGLAQGLVTVFESRTDNSDDVRYLAVTKAPSLIGCGITLPAEQKQIDGNKIILAEAFVAAHPLPSAVS